MRFSFQYYNSSACQLLICSSGIEIRFCKFSFTIVKATCPIFKQRNLTINQNQHNLECLITCQLDFTVLAEDLETAIVATKKEELLSNSNDGDGWTKRNASSRKSA